MIFLLRDRAYVHIDDNHFKTLTIFSNFLLIKCNVTIKKNNIPVCFRIPERNFLDRDSY